MRKYLRQHVFCFLWQVPQLCIAVHCPQVHDDDDVMPILMMSCTYPCFYAHSDDVMSQSDDVMPHSDDVMH